MKRIFGYCLGVGLNFWIATSAIAQSNLPLSLGAFDEYYHRAQLAGDYDTTISFLLKPLNFQVFANGFVDTLVSDRLHYQKGSWFEIEALPVLSSNLYNQKQPFGWNNGALLPASGYQQLTSLGFAAKVGPLRVQLYPELLYAENKFYDGFPQNAYGILWARYFGANLNYMDTPEKFGETTIRQQRWGQSFAKLEIGPISLGVSNENIYWGPGKNNSLIMSNNARGFAHLTIHTNQPIKTPLGYFEMQVIGAKLENSGFDPPNANFVWNGGFTAATKNRDWRYLSGVMATYQPKWIPRLSLGFTRVVQQYGSQAIEQRDYLGAFGALFRKDDINNVTEPDRDQLASLFMRYFAPKSGDEFYFEFARNDAFWNLRDFFLEPGHSAGYLLGYTKLFSYQQKEGQYIESNIELTLLQQSANLIIRNAGTFYIHSSVLQGYTNYGEILGAGSGPSSNVQTLNVAWVSGMRKLGIQVERYVHNNDLYIELFTDIQDPRRHWIDASAFIKGRLQVDRLILDAKIGVIKSFNYQYQIYNQLRTPEFYVPGVDVINFSGSLNLIYLL